MNNKKLLFGFFAAFVFGISFMLTSFISIQKDNTLQSSSSKTYASVSQSNQPAPIWINSVFLGPKNLGGRVRALLIDKDNTNIVYAGVSGGGLWKTSTAGTSWAAVEGISQNLIVTSITQSTNGDIYVGTGEQIVANNADMIGYNGFIGKGIYKSSGGGNTFTQLPSTNPVTLNNNRSEWAYVNDVYYNNATNKLYAGTNRGLRVSADGGNTWSNPIPSADTTVVQVSCAGNTVVVGFINKCFVSTDGGNSFTDQSTGALNKLPSANVKGMSVAVAPSNSNYIYVSIAKSDGNLFNVYRSVDAGNTWSVIGPGGTNTFSPLANRGWYQNTIVVFPDNENKVILAGANIWMWENGGNWIQKSVSNNIYKYDPENHLYYIPYSQHRIVFNPQNNKIFYVASDGGVSRTIDGGETYKLMYIGLAATSFYSATYGYMNTIIGGTQSSGTVVLLNFLPSLQNKYGEIILNDVNGGNVMTSYLVNFKATSYAAGLDAGSRTFVTIKRAADFNFDWVEFTHSRMSNLRYHALVPFAYWESLNDTQTTDTIDFINSRQKLLLENGNGNNKVYNDTIIPSQPKAKIVPGSIEIKCYIPPQTIVDDGAGKLRKQTISGNIVGDINYNNGIFNLTFELAPGYGSIVELKYNVRFNSGDNIIVKSYIDEYPFSHTLTSNLEPLDTIFVKDVIQSKFFIGATNSVWMTRKSLDFTKPPHWFNIAKFADPTDTIKCISNSKNGDCIFFGTRKGKLFRASNLLLAHDSITGDTLSNQNVVKRKDLTSNLNQANRVITSIAVDPSDANHIVVTLGNYNYSNYIYESRNALSNNPTFQLKQGNLPAMPVYSAIIEMNNPNVVIIGTENGLYTTDDISASSPNWSDRFDLGIPHVPVFSVKQQISDFPATSYIVYGDTILSNRHDTLVKTTGKIIIGTFGRGIFENNTFKVPNEIIYVPISSIAKTISNNSNLSIYPNPVTQETTISFSLDKKSNIEITVLDIMGRKVKMMNLSNAEGNQEIKINCAGMKNGTYYVNIKAGEQKFNGKFVVLK